MRRLRSMLWRVFGISDRGRRDRELTNELHAHLQFHIDNNLRAGMTPDEAHRQAFLRLGGEALRSE